MGSAVPAIFPHDKHSSSLATCLRIRGLTAVYAEDSYAFTPSGRDWGAAGAKKGT